jgi:Spy/CpxP family protein refolding chaperone
MKTKVAFSALIILLVSATMAMAGQGDRFKRHGRGFGMGPDAFSELNLTQEQTAKIQALRDAFRKDMIPVRAELVRKRAELKLMWMQTELDANKIRALQKEVHDIKGRLQEKLTDHKLEIYNILTPEQRMQMQAREFDRGHGPRGRMEGPRRPGMASQPAPEQ